MIRIVGNNENNRLFGTFEADLILAKGGRDRVSARGGDDTVNGGDDNDPSLNGGDGDDSISGGDGNDRINGQDDNDDLKGNDGNDRILGGDGDDHLAGNDGNDTLKGGDGFDILKGGNGNDTLKGERGDDVMRGQRGNDRMIWNPGEGSDIMNGGAGRDTAISNGGSIDEVYTLVQNGRRAIFNRVDPFPFSLDIRATERIVINGKGGNDSFEIGDLSQTDVEQVLFRAGDGDDSLDASQTSTPITADGGAGNDTLIGGDGADLLQGGDGNDTIDGSRGDDTMLGGAGDDRLIWNPGGGSDRMVGGDGFDTAVSNGGGQFLLQQVGTKAIFQRLNPFPFTLTITEAEVMEMNGGSGDDEFVVQDISNTDIGLVTFDGNEGNDLLNAVNTSTPLSAFGDSGDDTLLGGSGDDLLVGGAGTDTLSGGGGRDRFGYGADALGFTDTIQDYTIADDQYQLNGTELGIDQLIFQNAAPDVISGNSNVIILQGQTFNNAGEAAQAIADNNQIVSEEGVFVYFNRNLGFGRLVYSENLGAGGDINVFANMESIKDVAELTNFSAENFALA